MANSDSQEVILDAVQAVIVRDGVQGTSMRQVAQEADVSVGLLSYHFDDKESLILAAFKRATTRLFEASVQAGAFAETPSERLSLFLRGSFTNEFLDGNYLALRISLWAVALSDEGIAKLDLEYFDQYAEHLSNLIAAARPELDANEVQGRTVDMVAASNGVWLNWARFQNREALERGLALCETIALG